MAEREWEDEYVGGPLPWDVAEPEAPLVKLVEEGTLQPGRTLDVGCGTGTNAIWLAARGFDVLGVDIAPTAIVRAREKASAQGAVRCRFETLDFLSADPPGGLFDLVVDRGCFHLFDAAAQQDAFAARVAALLAPGGQWLSLIGSTELPPLDQGPPRRSVRDIVGAIEPHLKIARLDNFLFSVPPGFGDARPPGWVCLARRREFPAQPSTGA